MSRIYRDGGDLRVVDANGASRRARLHPAGYWMLPDPDGSQGNRPPGGEGGTSPTPPGGPGQPGGTYITPEMIIAAVQSVGGSTAKMFATAEEIAGAFNNAIQKYAATSFVSKPSRACLIGECAQESMWFQTLEELDQGAGQEYPPYWGRGFIQLTWRDNYAAFGHWCGRGDDFVDNPDLVLETQTAADAAIYYFTAKTWGGQNLCWWSDNDPGPNWSHISRAINRGGPYEGESGGEMIRATAINAVLAVTPDVIYDDGHGGGQPAAAAVRWMLDHLEAFDYTWDEWARTHMPGSGAGDCSSTVITAYVESGVATVEQMGGLGFTGTLAQAGWFITDQYDESLMVPGDLILIDWDHYAPLWTHVEMYIGGGQMCGHGGGATGTKRGPFISPLSLLTGVYRFEVRRYVE